MSFKQKNIAVTLANFTFIFSFALLRVLQLVYNDAFIPSKIVWLWVTVILLAIFVTIIGTILTHIVSAILEIIRTGNEEPEIEDLEDERDKFIDLRGTSLTYSITSFGILSAMATFALGYPPLIMFTLLIFNTLLAQIAGDIFRLMLYRRGF